MFENVDHHGWPKKVLGFGPKLPILKPLFHPYNT